MMLALHLRAVGAGNAPDHYVVVDLLVGQKFQRKKFSKTTFTWMRFRMISRTGICLRDVQFRRSPGAGSKRNSP